MPIEITFVAVSDEGQLITVSEKNGVDVWDREGHSQHLMDLPMEAKIRAFSSDGELIAYELPSGGNYILDRSTHKQTKISLDLDLQAWNRDAFSFDHRLFVGTTSTGGLDKKVIKVLRLSDGAIIKQFTIDYGHGASVSLSPDNNLLAYYITRAENTLHLVDLSTGQSKEIRVPDLRSINFSHDGRLLAMGTRSSIILYDVTDHQNPQYIQTILTRNTMWLAFSPDDTFLVASVYTKGVLMLGPLSDSR